MVSARTRNGDYVVGAGALAVGVCCEELGIDTRRGFLRCQQW